MPDPNRRLLISAAELLRPLLGELVFVGGCATGALVTDPAVDNLRPTFDVDTIIELSSYGQYSTLSDRLRDLGLSEDTSSGVICRWKAGSLLIDVMPTDVRILGFTNRWYTPAIETATWTTLGAVRIRLIAARISLRPSSKLSAAEATAMSRSSGWPGFARLSKPGSPGCRNVRYRPRDRRMIVAAPR
jgi:hypothetical protein